MNQTPTIKISGLDKSSPYIRKGGFSKPGPLKFLLKIFYLVI